MAKKLKAGDRVVFHKTKANKALITSGELEDVTLGRIYTIDIDWEDDPKFTDDAGESNWAVYQGPGGGAKFTKIVD